MPPEDTSPRPRTRDPEDKKLRLLRAAGQRFLFEGYDRTTTRAIAEDAGVNISLISRYFGGKRGLYRAVLEDVTDLIRNNPDRPPHPDGVLAGFLASLEPGRWPDTGGHPLKLLLQDTGDQEDRDLRAATLRAVVLRYILRCDRGSARRELRGDLVFALFCGIVTLREIGGPGPLTDATPDELGRELHAVVDDLLRDPDAGPR